MHGLAAGTLKNCDLFRPHDLSKMHADGKNMKGQARLISQMWVHLKWKEDEGQARLSNVRELSEALDNAAVGGVHAD
jgi:hypothetical protein